MAPAPTNFSGHSLQDYQMQLMLLEQQNKKRVSMVKEASVSEAKPEDPKAAQQDLQMQLMLLEQQNKRRLMMARRVAEQAERQKVAPIPPPAPVEVEAEVKPITVEDIRGEETQPKEKKGLIFPKLEKESPDSSIHDATATASSSKTECAPLPSSPKSDKSDLEIFEDAESVDFAESGDEENSFLTDEEYDILDASDEEVAP
jgi:next-to-BRCA1 protein 1